MNSIISSQSRLVFFKVLNLTDGEMKWTLKHLGRTENVYLTNYQQRFDVTERVKIAKLLLMMDYKLMQKFIGKNPKDINNEGTYLAVLLTRVCGD